MINNSYCTECVRQQLKIEELQKQLRLAFEELDLYRTNYRRPVVVKEIIHHPAKPRTSTCLYEIPAWDEYVYK